MQTKRTGECIQCGECCKKVRITSILSHCLSQHRSIEEIKKYYSLRKIVVVGYDQKIDRIYFEMDMQCDQLSNDNKCMLHSAPAEKPYICHRYPWFKDDIKTCGYSFSL